MTTFPEKEHQMAGVTRKFTRFTTMSCEISSSIICDVWCFRAGGWRFQHMSDTIRKSQGWNKHQQSAPTQASNQSPPYCISCRWLDIFFCSQRAKVNHSAYITVFKRGHKIYQLWIGHCHYFNFPLSRTVSGVNELFVDLCLQTCSAHIPLEECIKHFELNYFV